MSVPVNFPPFKPSQIWSSRHAFGDFGSRDPNHTLIKKTFTGFSDANRKNARPFLKRNLVARHKFPVGYTGWILIGYPVDKNFNTNAKFFAFFPKF